MVAHAAAGGGAPPLPAPLPVRARRLPADRSQRHHPGSQPLGRAPARGPAPVPGGQDAGLLRGPRGPASAPGRNRPLAVGAGGQEHRAPAAPARRARRSTRRSPCPSPAAGRGTRRSGSAGSCATFPPTTSSPRSSGSARRPPAATPRRARRTPTTSRSSRASACWPAGSPTTSTTCCMSSWATPTSLGCTCPPTRRPASTSTRWCGPRSARPSSPSSSWPTAAGARSRAASSTCRWRCGRWPPCSGRRSRSRPRSSGICSPELPAVTADPTQLRQIVMNLITNASDALGEESGTITLRTGSSRRESDAEPPVSVFLEVSDTGCGMDSSTLQRIFDPFFSTKFTGRGLGLAAVMGIVESHHGHVRIRTAPGEGTSFRVVLPAVTGEAEAVPRRPQRGRMARARDRPGGRGRGGRPRGRRAHARAPRLPRDHRGGRRRTRSACSTSTMAR